MPRITTVVFVASFLVTLFSENTQRYLFSRILYFLSGENLVEFYTAEYLRCYNDVCITPVILLMFSK